MDSSKKKAEEDISRSKNVEEASVASPSPSKKRSISPSFLHRQHLPIVYSAPASPRRLFSVSALTMDSSKKKKAQEDSSRYKTVDEASVPAASPSKKRRLVADSTAKLHKQPGAVKSSLLSNKCTAEDAQATDSSTPFPRLFVADVTAKFHNQAGGSKSRLKELLCTCTKACDKRRKESFSCSVCCRVQHKVCQTFMPLDLCNLCHSKKAGALLKKQTSPLKKLPTTASSTKLITQKKKITESGNFDTLSNRMDRMELQLAKVIQDQKSEAVARTEDRAQVEVHLKRVIEFLKKK